MSIKLNIKHKEWVNSVHRERPHIKNLPGALRLDKNERIMPFSQDFWDKVYKKIDQERVQAYPETENLYSLLAKFHGKEKSCFVLTAGSDGAIKNAFDLCVKPGNAVITLNPTFAMVNVYCDLFGAEKKLITCNNDLTIDVGKVVKSMDDKTSLVVIANPNSPTGTYIDIDQMEDIVNNANRLGIAVLIDEAYYEFCGESCITLMEKYSNVMITRTFSKAYGLAGLRIGYIIASPPLASLLYKFRAMYEVNSISLLFAETILESSSEMEQHIDELGKGRKYLERELERLKITYIGTRANFIHIDLGSKKEVSVKKLIQGGIKIRDGMPMNNFESFIRITLGPETFMKRFIEIIEDV